ncbi:MAG: AAA family ATPase [Syntrophobacteraceae bacterium]
MYLEFFKFRKSPFHITPDPDFLFLSPSHKEASASIFYGIETRKGFVAVTGEVGVGKTTILRSYLEGTDPEKIRIVYIFNAALSFERLLRQICSEFGIGVSSKDPAELVEDLFQYLIELYRKDRNVVLIIDEAQNMPVETLERLRMLSNLETSQEKLIQLILVGQPEFDAKLNLPELRQFKQRIAIRSRIAALTPDESVAYIQHRLMKASSFHNPVFTKKALKLLVKRANGIPRTLNILCDNALVTAFGYGRKQVDDTVVKEVLGDFGEEPPRRGFRWSIVRVLAAVVCIVAAAVLVSPGFVSNTKGPGKRSLRAGVFAPLPAGLKAKRTGPVCRLADAPAEKKSIAVAGENRGVGAPGKPGTGRAVESAKLTAAPAKTQRVPATVVKPDVAPARPVATAVRPVATPLKPAVVTAPTGKPETAAPKVLPITGATPRPEETEIDPTTIEPPARHLPNGQSGHWVRVRHGDSVSRLLIGIYGRADVSLFESFKQLNPQIRDINRLSVGEKIILP